MTDRMNADADKKASDVDQSDSDPDQTASNDTSEHLLPTKWTRRWPSALDLDRAFD
jgi:hypothetical protein